MACEGAGVDPEGMSLRARDIPGPRRYTRDPDKKFEIKKMPRKKNMKFKPGDAIEILWPPAVCGWLGIVVGSGLGQTPGDRDWRVHLPDGRDVWFRYDEITKLKNDAQKKIK